MKRRDIELEAASMAQQMIARELQQSQQTSARRGAFFGTYTEQMTTTPRTKRTSSPLSSSSVSVSVSASSTPPPSTSTEHKEKQQEEAAAIKALLQQYKAESKRLEDQVNSLAKIVEEHKRTKEASGEGGDEDGGGEERLWAKKNTPSAKKAPRRASPSRPSQATNDVVADQKIKRKPSSRDHAIKALREMKEMIQ